MSHSIDRIVITTTIVLMDGKDQLTSVTTTENASPTVFGAGNLASAISVMHRVSAELGERVAVQAVAGLRESA